MKPNRHALIFSTVWPEPDSSAAGVRQMHWIELLLQDFKRVSLISPAKPKQEQDWGRVEIPDRVEFLPMPLNDWSLQEQLKEWNPEIVLFDRFILEEQYGAMVYEALPHALVLMETQDLHFVRRAREPLRETWLTSQNEPQRYRTETAIRETASIERVDYSFVVSSYEERLLREEFGIGADQQGWVPFFYDPPVHAGFNSDFSERADFVWIGNFRHAPNADGLRWFRASIWPEIRKNLKNARLRVYGAYPSAEFMAWNENPGLGIEVKGPVRALSEVFQDARVNLAPLRFGAGVKGKILEGFRFGVPAITTPVGAEGLLPEGSDLAMFPGGIETDPKRFAEAAVRMHSDSGVWRSAHDRAKSLMENQFARAKIEPALRARIGELLQQKRAGDLPRWRSRILRHELSQSRKYFSKWIEAKERLLAIQEREENP
ncbi:MAG: glycosyltransferase [Bdellovibrionales bacterium]|nr:glycosyltransferase [Bdellovibrionales bacterium]